MNKFDEDGYRHGYWEEHSLENVLISEGNYEHGLKEGLWIFYDESGVLVSKTNYKRDEKEGEELVYNYKLELTTKSNYISGLLEGVQYEYITINNRRLIKTIGYFKNSERHGKNYSYTQFDVYYMYYYDHGVLKYVKTFDTDANKNDIAVHYHNKTGSSYEVRHVEDCV